MLLVFTFLVGAAVHLTSPAWQGPFPRLVPKQDLDPAVAANSIGVNVSRAVGPALGGATIRPWGSPRLSGSMPPATWQSLRPSFGGSRHKGK